MKILNRMDFYQTYSEEITALLDRGFKRERGRPSLGWKEVYEKMIQVSLANNRAR